MERISVYQFKIVGMAILLGSTLLTSPTYVLLTGGRDGWMCLLPGFALTIPYGLLVLSLMKDYPGKNILQISEEVFGKWPGKGIGVLYLISVTYFGGLITAQSGVIFGNSIMPLTPSWIFNIATMILVVILVFSGIEVFARFTEIVFPLVALVIVIIMAFSLPLIEKGILFPILENGLMPVLKGMTTIFPFVMEYIGFLFILLPFLPTDQSAYKKLRKSMVIIPIVIGIGTTAFLVIYMMTFGYYDATRITYGVISLAKTVEIKNTLSGGESVMEVVEFGSIIIKAAGLFFACYWSLKTVFGLKSRGWILLLAGVFLFIADRFIRTMDLLREFALIDKYVMLPLIGLWVPILWITVRWKRRKTT